MKKISVIIPYIRPAGLKICLIAIHHRAGIRGKGYQIIAERDVARIGCPRMVKRLVSKAAYNLIMFLADDVIPQQDFMKNALVAMGKLPGGWGLVGLNDGHHNGNDLATHWLADKRLLPLLDGEFFHTGYIHTFCDMELTTRCKRLGRYIWAEDARLRHNHPLLLGRPLTGDYARVYSPAVSRHDKNLFIERRKNEWR